MISSLLKHVVLLDCFARLLINKVYPLRYKATGQRPLVTKLPAGGRALCQKAGLLRYKNQQS